MNFVLIIFILHAIAAAFTVCAFIVGMFLAAFVLQFIGSALKQEHRRRMARVRREFPDTY
jgi:uncharacterized membrane protein YGL010W